MSEKIKEIYRVLILAAELNDMYDEVKHKLKIPKRTVNKLHKQSEKIMQMAIDIQYELQLRHG